MRKTALSCAKSTAFRFAARRARFSCLCAAAFRSGVFCTGWVSMFSGQLSIRSGKCLLVQVIWAEMVVMRRYALQLLQITISKSVTGKLEKEN